MVSITLTLKSIPVKTGVTVTPTSVGKKSISRIKINKVSNI